jgi:hypothetical protein
MLSAGVLGLGLPAVAGATARVVAAHAMPTTAPFEATGPNDPRGGAYGLVAPRRFELNSVPWSWSVNTSDLRWSHWGSSETTGAGTGHFEVVMSPAETVRFTLVLSRKRFVSCNGGHSHDSYTRLNLHIADYQGTSSNIRAAMYPGCRQLR